MGRTKRQYPLGKYRLRLPRVPESKKAYPLDLEYTWNRHIYRKFVNIVINPSDWNQEANHGRGEVRASYGTRLFQYVIEEARKAGYRHLYIESFAEFADAIRMYSRHGFTELSSRLGHSGHTATTIHMKLDLF